MKFGDLILNTSAGDKNPNKVSMFILGDSKGATALSRNGGRILFGHNWRDHVVKVGRLCFDDWDDALAPEES